MFKLNILKLKCSSHMEIQMIGQARVFQWKDSTQYFNRMIQHNDSAEWFSIQVEFGLIPGWIGKGAVISGGFCKMKMLFLETFHQNLDVSNHGRLQMGDGLVFDYGRVGGWGGCGLWEVGRWRGQEWAAMCSLSLRLIGWPLEKDTQTGSCDYFSPLLFPLSFLSFCLSAGQGPCIPTLCLFISYRQP